MFDAPWLTASTLDGENVAAGWPLPALLDLLARYHAGQTLLIWTPDRRLLAVRHPDGTVSISTPLVA
jgi:hypothetical protein